MHSPFQGIKKKKKKLQPSGTKGCTYVQHLQRQEMLAAENSIQTQGCHLLSWSDGNWLVVCFPSTRGPKKGREKVHRLFLTSTGLLHSQVKSPASRSVGNRRDERRLWCGFKVNPIGREKLYGLFWATERSQRHTAFFLKKKSYEEEVYHQHTGFSSTPPSHF